MSADTSPFPDLARICMRVAHCPVCGEQNRCRLETGEPYKGACWCERPTLSGAAMRRLLIDLPEPRCLCASCLEGIAANPEITWDELVLRSRQSRPPLTLVAGDFYEEGPALVFTEQYHRRRGYCCENGCRHCPYRPEPRVSGP